MKHNKPKLPVWVIHTTARQYDHDLNPLSNDSFFGMIEYVKFMDPNYNAAQQWCESNKVDTMVIGEDDLGRLCIGPVGCIDIVYTELTIKEPHYQTAKQILDGLHKRKK